MAALLSGTKKIRKGWNFPLFTGSGDGNSTKLSGNQLVQLELRLKEAEEAMERAMEKMGLDIKQLKQDTGYKACTFHLVSIPPSHVKTYW